jgi:hypothetical protein
MFGFALEIVGHDACQMRLCLVQWTGFARGGLHVVDCDTWTSWKIDALLAFDTIRA